MLQNNKTQWISNCSHNIQRREHINSVPCELQHCHCLRGWHFIGHWLKKKKTKTTLVGANTLFHTLSLFLHLKKLLHIDFFFFQEQNLVQGDSTPIAVQKIFYVDMTFDRLTPHKTKNPNNNNKKKCTRIVSRIQLLCTLLRKKLCRSPWLALKKTTFFF